MVKLGTSSVQSGSYYDINERTAPLRPGRFKKNTSGKRRQKQAAQLSTSGGCEDKGGYLLHTDGQTEERTDTMVKITFQSVSGQKVEKDNDKSEVLIPHAADEEELVLPLRPRKSPLNGLCCLTFGLVVFMASLVLASIYVYRYYFIHHNPRENLFHCSVLYEDSAYAPLRGPEQLEENIGIYLEDNYEQISVPVPHFGGSDPADIIHDFHRGLTAYHDIALDKCYVTELNTTVVMPPRNLWELLINVKKGTYLPQTYIIHEEMVVTGKVHNMRQLGPFIYRLCHGKDTYRLSRRLSHRRVSKRQTKDCHTIRHFENTFVVETLICDEA